MNTQGQNDQDQLKHQRLKGVKCRVGGALARHIRDFTHFPGASIGTGAPGAPAIWINSNAEVVTLLFIERILSRSHCYSTQHLSHYYYHPA
jgi:hypothetical protein